MTNIRRESVDSLSRDGADVISKINTMLLAETHPKMMNHLIISNGLYLTPTHST